MNTTPIQAARSGASMASVRVSRSLRACSHAIASGSFKTTKARKLPSINSQNRVTGE